jgi:hypothetical protein
VLNEITTLNSELKIIEARVQTLTESNHLFKSIKIRNLTSDKKKVRKKLFTSIDNYLLLEDKEFEKLATENLSLFKKDKINFKVTKHDRHEMSSATYRFEGKLSKNGYSYIYEAGTNWALFPFDGFYCPMKLKGKINHWGKIEIDVTEIDHKLNALPENFVGSISEKGIIDLETDKRSNDLFFGGKLVVGEIMAFHFSRTSSALRKMIQNKRKMLMMIRNFRNAL